MMRPSGAVVVVYVIVPGAGTLSLPGMAWRGTFCVCWYGDPIGACCWYGEGAL